MAAFQNSLDIINRAIQKVGGQRIASLTEDSENATEAVACYDKLRRAELRRNLWRFAIRRTALRPINGFNGSKYLTFATWAIATTYAVNDVVTASDGLVYFSTQAANLAHDPASTTGYWTQYFGPLVASEFVTTWGAGFTYAKGDHAVGSDAKVYASLVATNLNHNPVGDNNVHWSLATTDSDDTTKATSTTFYAGELVFIGASVYLSLENANDDTPPSTNWVTLSGAPTLALPNFIYPIGTGPLSQSATRNVYRLPYGYLREAPRSPKQGSYTALGAPTNLSYTDWDMEGNFIVSQSADPILYRFVSDVADVTQMDDMYCEGLACRVALELAIRMTQSDGRLTAIASEYERFMKDARMASFIEQGAIEPDLDDYLAVRL